MNNIQKISIFVIALQFCPATFAQDDSTSAPVPGSQVNSVIESEKNAESSASQSCLISVQTNAENSLSSFALSDLPVSIKGLNVWLSKYKQEMKESQINEEKLTPLITWLDGLIKAHTKLANTFAKHDNLKTDYESECNLLKQLRQIKDEFLYLKVQVLIKEKKLKQAIPILIDIVCAEPNSALGQTAYQHLKHSGFSASSESAQLAQPVQSLPDKSLKNKQSAIIKN